MSNMHTRDVTAQALHCYAIFQGSCCVAVMIMTTLGLTLQKGINLDILSASASTLSCLGFIVGDIVAFKVLGKVFGQTLEQGNDRRNRILGTILFEITVLFGTAACVSRAYSRPDYKHYGIYWAFTTAAFVIAIVALAAKVKYAYSLVRRLQHLSRRLSTRLKSDIAGSHHIPSKGQPQQQTNEGQLHTFRVYLIATMTIYMGNAVMFFVLPIWSCYFAAFTAIFYYWALRRCVVVRLVPVKVPLKA